MVNDTDASLLALLKAAETRASDGCEGVTDDNCIENEVALLGRCDPCLIATLADALRRSGEALRRILAEPYGCPMCDSGKLRNPDKEHWDTCGFKQAADILSRPNGAEVTEA